MTVQPSSASSGLPKKTQSLCPECRAVISADIFEEDGKVVMRKECKTHGEVRDVIWGDAELYLKAERFAVDGIGMENPHTASDLGCPSDCGLCDRHLTHTLLAVIDLTSRCNLACPVCFADANAAGSIYEPSYDEVVKMLELLRAGRPVPTPAVQFSGGEPTLHPRFLDLVKKARGLGISQVQVATNGIKLARNPDYAQELKDAGLKTVYLQFDGTKEENYIRFRGKPLLDTKKRAIEHARRTKPRPLTTVLVPTIVNTVNDDQVGPILDFAIEHREVVRGVNYQPVAFTGRIPREERVRQRFTLSDLVDRLVAHAPYLTREDFFPVPTVAPLSFLTGVLSGSPKLTFTCHSHCGLAAFLYISEDGDITPVTRFVDVQGMMSEMTRLAERASGRVARLLLKIMGILRTGKSEGESKIKSFDKHFGRFFDKEGMPDGLDIPNLLAGIISKGRRDDVGRFTWKTLMVSAMHFQDLYNYDIERVRRCGVHYTTPDGRVIPFCSYNTGPCLRERVEERFSIPIAEWQDRKHS